MSRLEVHKQVSWPHILHFGSWVKQLWARRKMCRTLINFLNIPETKMDCGRSDSVVRINQWPKERGIDARWENNSGSSVIICVVFYWETLVPVIQVQGTMLCTTSLNISEDQVGPSYYTTPRKFYKIFFLMLLSNKYSRSQILNPSLKLSKL